MSRCELPALGPEPALAPELLCYLDALAGAGFRGTCRSRWSERLVRATDNSIYQIEPAAVLLPRDADDVALAMRRLTAEGAASLHLTPRGGGTGTNGQSLSAGVVLDVSRHMNRILELDPGTRTARIQPGVIRDVLNDAAAPHGLFFPPTVAPSNRATIGGMIGTDACGKGSRRYGRTGDHLVALKVVLADGTLVDTSAPPEHAALTQLGQRLAAARPLIEARFPRLHRGLTGYNLRQTLTEGGLDLNHLFAGAEGTLGVVVEATVRLTPIPHHRRLLLVEYGHFAGALEAARDMLPFGPSAIETADEMVLELARQDVIWQRVRHLFRAPERVRAINLVEFEDDDPQLLEAQCRDLAATLTPGAAGPGAPLAVSAIDDPGDRDALWALRAKGVGLLGRLPGDRKPVAFMEDTVVPPEVLPDYVAELRRLLDAQGLRYGMFGHVDVGCLHVRPALDLRDPGDAALVRRLSDAVCELVERYGGLFWGEHGRGFRGEYAPRFMGRELYALMCEVKALLDPDERLNPGKLARVDPALPLTPLDGVTTRGQRDRRIDAAALAAHGKALECNGNGACFDYRASEVMCPSYRVTGERRHSPKGRAMLVREWLTRASAAGYDFSRRPGLGLRARAPTPPDLSHEVVEALDGCLGCKACATSCPVHVDIPALRSCVLHHYFGRYRRPLRDWAYYGLESVLVASASGPRPLRRLLGSSAARRAAAGLGLVDLPAVPSSGLAGLGRRYGLRPGAPAPEGATVLVPDPYTAAYEPALWSAALALLERLGHRPRLAPLRAPGKARHNRGFRGGFRRQRDAVAALLAPWAEQGMAVVSLEPSHRHLLIQEYTEDGDEPLPVQSVAGWLAGRPPPAVDLGQRWWLLAHCTERTQDPTFAEDWTAALAAFGVRLEVPALGCCGMAGAYGHEREHRDYSRRLFEEAWQPLLASLAGGPGRVVATGFSCREQIRRHTGRRVPHPLEALAEALVPGGG